MTREALVAYWSGWRVSGRARDIRRLMRQLDVAEPSATLGEIRAGVHVVHGANDRAVPPRVGKEIAEAIPNAQLTYLERTGHAPQNERPDANARIITAML
jgi:pimeloyl-ACP methyl ester carboxylesterase